MNIKFLGMSLVSLALASSFVLSGCGEEKAEAPATEPVAVEEVGSDETTAPTPEGETPVAAEEKAPATEPATEEKHG